jgi:hypothetical protein
MLPSRLPARRRPTHHDERRSKKRGGRQEQGERINRPWLVLRRGPDRACPRRLRVRYERAGRSFYSAAAAGGAKMTPAQIAEAQRLAREWKPTK